MAKKIKNKINKEEILKNIKESDLKVRDLEIKDIMPNVIQDVIIIINNGTQELHTPSNMIGEKFKKWLKDRGGIFSKDVNRYNKGKKHGKYALLQSKDTKTIIRLIEDDELMAFDFLKLIHGKIKDKPFMILKTVDNDKKLTCFERYIEKIETMKIASNEIETNNIPLETSTKGSYSSHNLLEE